MSNELEILGVDPVSLGIPASMTLAAAMGIRWVGGPSLQAVGRAFGDWTELRVRNLLRLGERVEKRVDTGGDQGASVSPRLLHKVLDDGSWIDDDVAQEYLAGILVGSRTRDSSNEDGVYMAHVVSTLTAAQLRMHHAVYERLERLAPGVETGDAEEAERHAVWAPLSEVARVMGRADAETAASVAASGLAQAGLLRVRAIGDPSLFTPPGFFEGAPTRPAFVVIGTLLGTALYRIATVGGVKYQAPAGSHFQEAWVHDSSRVPEGL